MVITAEHIATTIERIGTLCNELRDTNSSALPFVDRLHGVMLASELYDMAGQLDAQREETLSSYFGENSLRQNLQNIVLIEDMQRELSNVYLLVNAENADTYAQKIKDAYSSKQLLSKLPVVERIWGADCVKPNGKYKFKTVFNAAHEDLTEPQKLATLSVDPSDSIYNTSIRRKRFCGFTPRFAACRVHHCRPHQTSCPQRSVRQRFCNQHGSQPLENQPQNRESVRYDLAQTIVLPAVSCVRHLRRRNFHPRCFVRASSASV